MPRSPFPVYHDICCTSVRLLLFCSIGPGYDFSVAPESQLDLFPAIVHTHRPPRKQPKSIFASSLPLLALSLAAAAALSACDRMKTALNTPQVDSAWQNDSSRLEPHPTVVFRVDRSGKGTRVLPFATIGDNGIRSLRMSSRGWRAFDLAYLQNGSSFVPYRSGDILPATRSLRGMWEAGSILDSLPCPSPVPAALVNLDSRVELVTSGTDPLPIPRIAGLGDGELQRVISTVTKLVAPAAGISLNNMKYYDRNIQVVPTGVSDKPTVVISFDDPRPLPDSAARMISRTRHLIVVLDKGVYGYKPSLTYADVSSNRISPRRKFLGVLDTDGDGKAELFFGLQAEEFPLVTYVYRFEGDTWMETFKYERTRCG